MQRKERLYQGGRVGQENRTLTLPNSSERGEGALFALCGENTTVAKGEPTQRTIRETLKDPSRDFTRGEQLHLRGLENSRTWCRLPKPRRQRRRRRRVSVSSRDPGP